MGGYLDKRITVEQLESLREGFLSDPSNKPIMNTVTNNGIEASSKDYFKARDVRHHFNILIPTETKILDQKASGRCWLFSGLTFLLHQSPKLLKIHNFEFSENYLMFYDKLEKANSFLEQILEYKDESLHSYRMRDLLQSLEMKDGGNWFRFSYLIKKYGIVPYSSMPETYHSSKSEQMNNVLAEKMREYAHKLRKEYQNGISVEDLRHQKLKMIEEIYRILCICLGVPPKTIYFEAHDKIGKFIRLKDLTPKDFYKYFIDINLDEYAVLSNYPDLIHPMNRTYTHKLGFGYFRDNKDKVLNTNMEVLKVAAIEQLKDGVPVWFSSDVKKDFLKSDGILDTKAYDLESLFKTQFSLFKGQQLDYLSLRSTHAMNIVGVNVDDNGNPTKWRVVNSYGTASGNNGYLVMTDKWFEKYAYRVVIKKRYLTQHIKNLLNTEPIVLDPLYS